MSLNVSFELTPDDVALLNPNTQTCPIFRSQYEADIAKAIYRRVPVFVRESALTENPWKVTFHTMFHMANDSALFRDAKTLRTEGFHISGNHYRRTTQTFLPLYEAKMASYYDHRFGTFEGRPETRESSALDTPTAAQHQDARFSVLPRYWITAEEVSPDPWLLTIRLISHATNDRTFVAQVLPRAGLGHSLAYVRTNSGELGPLLCANFCSLVFDFVVRQKMGGLNLSYFIVKQLPVLAPPAYTVHRSWLPASGLADWIFPRLLELTYTAWDLEPFAQVCGWAGPPFHWDEERRFLLRCELDAAFFHLYLPSMANGNWRPAHIADGCPYDETPEQLADVTRHAPKPRDAVAYIMDTFPIVRRKDEENHGEYRTKRVILEIYDAMQESTRTGQPYQTRLDPPPADPRCCHLPKAVESGMKAAREAQA